MNILWVIASGGLLLLVASRTYPFWIARIFEENDENPPPSEQFADGKDYIKTPSHVVFAHHFASIAGAGPIVGPIIALSFGWGPAWLWIVLGGIFYGAVHDMSAMFVSVREGGKTIAEIARRTLGRGGYLLFVAFLLLVLSIVNAIFLKLSASALTSVYPLSKLELEPGQTLLRQVSKDGVPQGVIGGIATMSVVAMTLVAPVLGWLLFRGKIKAVVAFCIAASVCVASVLIGFAWPIALPTVEFGAVVLGPRDIWQIVIATYVLLACMIPVWLVVQPRDFMNVQILYAGLALLLAGAIAGGFQGSKMQLPANAIAEQAAVGKSVWPIMFITIACGAISGFHSLVATGTTVKQIPRESDCRRIGYNAMILESFLALLVLVAVGSQMDLTEYRINMDSSQGGSAILTFAIGCGKMFSNLGIPMAVGCVLGILVIEGFLITTLDTAVRLGRYLFEELWVSFFGERTPTLLRRPSFNAACVVALMVLFAYSKSAYDALWPFFGAGNQLIGALTLTTVAVWLLKKRRKFWFAAIPAVFMVATAVAALLLSVRDQFASGEKGAMRFVIGGAGVLLLLLAVGFVAVATIQVVLAIKANNKADRNELE